MLNRSMRWRGHVEEGAATRQPGFFKPSAIGVLEPPVVTGEGKGSLTNGTLGKQLPGPKHLGVEATIVGHTQELARLFCGHGHRFRLCVVHCDWLLTEDVLPRTQGRDSLRGMHSYRSCNVHRVDPRVRQGSVQFREDLRPGYA